LVLFFGGRGKKASFLCSQFDNPSYNPNPELQPAVESDVDGGSGVALKIGRLVSLVPPDSRPRNTKLTTYFRLLVKTGESPTDFRLA